MACHTAPDEDLFPQVALQNAARDGQLLTVDIALGQFFSSPVFPRLDASPAERPLMDSADHRRLVGQAKGMGARKISVITDRQSSWTDAAALVDAVLAADLQAELAVPAEMVTTDAADCLAAKDAGMLLVLDACALEAGVAQGSAKMALRLLRDAGVADSRISVGIEYCSHAVDQLIPLWTWIRNNGLRPRLLGIGPNASVAEKEWFGRNATVVQQSVASLSELDSVQFNRKWISPQPEVGTACQAHLCSCLINGHGDVFPCRGIDLVVGNVREHSLARVLRDSEILEDQRDHQAKIAGPCSGCSLLARCCGCRGLAYQVTGDHLASEPLCQRNTDRQCEIDVLPVPVDPLMPHRPPMRMVTSLLKVGERMAIVEALVTPDFPFLSEDGFVEEAACLELIAQAAAAHEGFRHRRGAVPMGYLLGASKVKIEGRARIGDVLTIHVHKEAKIEDFGIIKGTVLNAGGCIAHGSIKVYRTTQGATP